MKKGRGRKEEKKVYLRGRDERDLERNARARWGIRRKYGEDIEK